MCGGHDGSLWFTHPMHKRNGLKRFPSEKINTLSANPGAYTCCVAIGSRVGGLRRVPSESKHFSLPAAANQFYRKLACHAWKQRDSWRRSAMLL